MSALIGFSPPFRQEKICAKGNVPSIPADGDACFDLCFWRLLPCY